jgi:hypothetical protein
VSPGLCCRRRTRTGPSRFGRRGDGQSRESGGVDSGAEESGRVGSRAESSRADSQPTKWTRPPVGADPDQIEDGQMKNNTRARPQRRPEGEPVTETGAI